MTPTIRMILPGGHEVTLTGKAAQEFANRSVRDIEARLAELTEAMNK